MWDTMGIADKKIILKEIYDYYDMVFNSESDNLKENMNMEML